MMKSFLVGLVLLVVVVRGAEVIDLKVDFSEAEQSLAIIGKAASHTAIPDEDWRRLFATAPYQLLKAREVKFGGEFSDDEFKTFLLSAEAAGKRNEWEQSLAGMKQANLKGVGEGVLKWLPAGATIHARVFPEIKPRSNSFVWSPPEGGGAAIFLYLKGQTQGQFENTVAHECHHIGLDSLSKRQQAAVANLAPNVKTTMQWMSAFGEGLAMLAATGSINTHPHSEDDALTRARWDGDLMRFNADVAALEQFFDEVLDGKFATEDAIMTRASPFWGDVQGAWYTVGYEMAVLVEAKSGHAALLECMIDFRKLLVLYNQVATEANAKGAKLAVWSAGLIQRLGE